MKRSIITAILLALAVTGAVAAEGESAATGSRERHRTLDEMTERVDTITGEDGSDVISRVFVEPIPWEEFVAALEATSDRAPTPVVTMDIGECPAPADGDYDGDGLVGDEELPRNGEYFADRYKISAEFASYIEPAIDVQYSGSTTYTTEATTFSEEDLFYKETVTETLEFKQTFNGNPGITLNLFPLKDDPKDYFVFDFNFTSSQENQRIYTKTLSKERTRTTQLKYTLIRKEAEDQTIQIGPNSGRVSGFVRISYDGGNPVTVELRNFSIAVGAYSPFTGQLHAIGMQTFSGPYILGYGDDNNSALVLVNLTGLNSYWFLDKLAEGWMFDFIMAEGYSATALETGENISVLTTLMNSRTARISVHDGPGGRERSYGQIAISQPDGVCLTPKTMLEAFVGAENVDYEVREDGSLGVTRIYERANCHADKNFFELTEAEQAEYGRWVIGYDHDDELGFRGFDLATTALVDEEKVFFYYITAADFEDLLGPANESPMFVVANDGSAPRDMVVLDGACEQDWLELEVSSIFAIEEAYSQYMGSIYTPSCGGTLFDATYYGHRTAWGSEEADDAAPVPDADFYGVEVRLGGYTPYETDWLDISTLMGDDTAQAELMSFRGYPYYDYVLRFRASPALLGGFPVRDVQVRTVKPRQSFLVGYTGRAANGQYMDCREWEVAGHFYSYGYVRHWYTIDNIDSDYDGFYDVAKTGIDFDDADPMRFPYAPEHLDGVDNDGDGSVDEEPLLCPESTFAYDIAECDLDDRMGWYGESPNVSMELRTRYTDGSAGAWESLGSGTTCSFMMPGGTDVSGAEVRTTNWGAGGYPSGLNFIAQQGLMNQSYDVSHEIEAERGVITPPMEIQTDGVNTWVVTPVGTEDASAAAAEYRVRIETAGNYYVWTRVRADDAWHDSFYVEVLEEDGDLVRFGTNSDTKALFRFDVAEPSITYGLFSWTLVNHWWNLIDTEYNFVPVVYYLGPGTYTIRFTVRDLGTELEALRVEPFPFSCSGADLDNDGWTTCEGDCWDKNDDVNPGMAESCSTGYDDDCDGEINEGCSGGGGTWPKEPPAAKPVFD